MSSKLKKGTTVGVDRPGGLLPREDKFYNDSIGFSQEGCGDLFRGYSIGKSQDHFFANLYRSYLERRKERRKESSYLKFIDADRIE